ncbi:MAG: asparagine synthase C-terminal domain-containing protein [Candidatus Omnitrophica bacterium]|nr:asparagine synthase C-terminal domain-containing protein [Candidatus Omnitrophota bacterium]
MKNTILELKNSLSRAVPPDEEMGLLFSGGLDSSVLAAINPKVKAITVSLESYGEDISLSQYLAKILDLDYHHKEVKIEEAIDIIPEVVRILETFDPAIPNDIVVYFALKKAKEMGIKMVIAGDGSDELFAGYSFMKNMDNLEAYIKRISGSMRFSSNDMADYFGIKISQPYLNKQIVDAALSLPRDLKIKQESGKVWGKWVLRKAFEDVLPEKIIWQTKRPLEKGSGMEKIREIISSKVSGEEWKEAREKIPVKFISREHYYYYRVYRNVVGNIPTCAKKEKACSGCGAGMKKDAFHCGICGYVAPWEK